MSKELVDKIKLGGADLTPGILTLSEVQELLSLDDPEMVLKFKAILRAYVDGMRTALHIVASNIELAELIDTWEKLLE